MRVQSLFLTVALGSLIACGGDEKKSKEPVENEESQEEVEFDGETSGGAIPIFPEGTNEPEEQEIDIGTVTPDDTCCENAYGVDAAVPAEATGLLVGESTTFGEGIALTRSGDSWSVSLCFPVNESSTYFYEFTWVAGVIEEEIITEEGETETVSYDDVRTETYVDSIAPTITLADGTEVNFQEDVPTCD